MKYSCKRIVIIGPFYDKYISMTRYSFSQFYLVVKVRVSPFRTAFW